MVEALRLLEGQGFGPVLVLNQAGVVMGAAYRDKLAAAAGEAAVGTVMRFGVSTVRPSENAAALAHRMGHAEVTGVVVTRSDGTLVGLFFAADSAVLAPRAATSTGRAGRVVVSNGRACRGFGGRLARAEGEDAGWQVVACPAGLGAATGSGA